MSDRLAEIQARMEAARTRSADAYIAQLEERYERLLAALATQRALVAELVGALGELVAAHDAPFEDYFTLLYNDLIWDAARAALERAAKEQP